MVQTMMLGLIQQPAFRHYFKRDEVLEEIAVCNIKLQDCLGHFDRSINLRLLENAAGTKQVSEWKNPDMSLYTKGKKIHEIIRRVQERQNELDRSSDLVDEQNYAEALHSDKSVLEVLKSPRSSTWSLSQVDANVTLHLRDREAIERDIRALKAAYGGPVPTLPDRTITKCGVRSISRLKLSSATVGAHVVAIKLLDVHTSKESFINEVELWKKLKHPNVLELYGASVAEGSLPWSLKGLCALTLDVHSYTQDDCPAFPTPLMDALENLMKAPDMQTLELPALAHFSLAATPPRSHLVTIGCRPLATTPNQTPTEGPSHLRTLCVEHSDILQTIVDTPFLSLLA
ncbi:hypothetical protein DXG01_000475 [Tephrocybe rancida]|nr:hypothetical protein DXG01_000475 [Tephrocybe rancida]